MFKSGYTYLLPQMLIILNDKIVKNHFFCFVEIYSSFTAALPESFLPLSIAPSPGHPLTWMIFNLSIVSPGASLPWLTFMSNTVFYII